MYQEIPERHFKDETNSIGHTTCMASFSVSNNLDEMQESIHYFLY